MSAGIFLMGIEGVQEFNWNIEWKIYFQRKNI
jgi:hypothetical protein